ncbi:MAG: sulfotransferase [bacterium]
MAKTPVCIAGMHRSGTSLVARLLQQCGLHLGPDNQLMPPQQDNPDGFFEHVEIVRLNNEILAALNGGWDLPPALPAGGLEYRQLPAHFRIRARRLVAAIGCREPWGWKDPRNSLTLPFWRGLYPDLKVIACVRHPLEVVRSLQRRSSCSPALGQHLWLTYYRSLLAATTPAERLVTHYDSYFQAPEAELQRLLTWLDWSDVTTRITAACAAVDPQQRHNRHWKQQRCNPLELWPEVQWLHEVLLDEAGQLDRSTAATNLASPVTTRPTAAPEDTKTNDPVPANDGDTPGLVFLHIPKTAGSTLRRIVERQYDARQIFTLEGWRVSERDFMRLSPKLHRQVRLLEGHQFFGLHELLPTESRYITMLRDPVERIVSQYYHILRSPEHYLHEQVTGDNLSVADFATAGLAPELDNGQLRYVAGLSELPVGQCTPDHLELARRHLERYFAVTGLVERFDESIVLMKRILGWQPPLYLPTNIDRRRNDREPLTAEARAAIRDANRLDYEFYRFADQLLDRQIVAEGDEFRRDLANLQQLNQLPGTRQYLDGRSRDLCALLNRTGVEKLQQGDSIWALQAFMKAAEIWPGELTSHLNLAMYYLRQDDPEMAKPPVAAALRLEPEQPQALQLRHEIEVALNPESAASVPAPPDRPSPVTQESREPVAATPGSTETRVT